MPSNQLLNYPSKVHAVNICASVAGAGRSLRLITMNCDHITVNCNTQSITPPPAPPRPACCSACLLQAAAALHGSQVIGHWSQHIGSAQGWGRQESRGRAKSSRKFPLFSCRDCCSISSRASNEPSRSLKLYNHGEGPY